MENRIDVILTPENLEQILQGISTLKTQMPFLIKLSENDKTTLQMLSDGRKPFVEKAYDFASRNADINPGDYLIEAGKRDLSLYTTLATVENQLSQLLEGVRDTKQLAGAETYEVSRFVYMKAKMAEKMKVTGMKTIVDELSKLYKQPSATATTEPAK
jgi:hypothetical protein